MKEIKSNGLEDIISQAIEEMKSEQGNNFSLEKINLAELERRTGISRAKLRRLKENGFVFKPHALGALYYSNMYGGSFSAILLNIPGDSPAITTALDGYPMAKKGRPGQALMAANLASFIGGTIGILILTLTASGLATLGLKFGYAEMTLILLIAMTSISWLIGENPNTTLCPTYFNWPAPRCPKCVSP